MIVFNQTKNEINLKCVQIVPKHLLTLKHKKSERILLWRISLKPFKNGIIKVTQSDFNIIFYLRIMILTFYKKTF